MQPGVIIFCSVRFLLKKVTKLVFLKTEIDSNRPVSVILEQKLVQTDQFRFGLTRFFGSVFSILGL